MTLWECFWYAGRAHSLGNSTLSSIGSYDDCITIQCAGDMKMVTWFMWYTKLYIAPSIAREFLCLLSTSALFIHHYPSIHSFQYRNNPISIIPNKICNKQESTLITRYLHWKHMIHEIELTVLQYFCCTSENLRKLRILFWGEGVINPSIQGMNRLRHTCPPHHLHHQ